MLGPFHCGRHCCRLPLSLTYGVNLPSSLTTLLPIVLGFSPHLPVSVCGTGAFTLDSGFSCQCGISLFGTCFPSPSGIRTSRSFIPGLSTSLGRTLPVARQTYPSASPLLFYRVTAVQEFQPVVHRLRSITPRLRPRLTLGGRTFPRNPQVFDGKDSHSTLATYSGILPDASSTRPCSRASPLHHAPLPIQAFACIPQLRYTV